LGFTESTVERYETSQGGGLVDFVGKYELQVMDRSFRVPKALLVKGGRPNEEIGSSTWVGVMGAGLRQDPRGVGPTPFPRMGFKKNGEAPVDVFPQPWRIQGTTLPARPLLDGRRPALFQEVRRDVLLVRKSSGQLNRFTKTNVVHASLVGESA
jgi:hypothetical protein